MDVEFEARTLKPYAQPVEVRDLREREIYFSVHFLDEEMYLPEIRTLVYLGRDLYPGDPGTLYFQDAGSYRDGVRFDSDRREEGFFIAQPEDELDQIFTFERALDRLMVCSLRRKETGLD